MSVSHIGQSTFVPDRTSVGMPCIKAPTEYPDVDVPVVRRPSRAGVVVVSIVAAALLGGGTTATTASPLRIVRADAFDQTSAGGSGIPAETHQSPTEAPNIDSDLSAAVRDLRTMTGLTWDQLGKLFGVTRRAIHHWANGNRMTAHHVEILGELTRFVQDLPCDASERRSYLLAPRTNGYSIYDQLRARYSGTDERRSSRPFTPAQLLGADD